MPGVFHWVTSLAEHGPLKIRSTRAHCDCDRFGSGKSQRRIHGLSCKWQRAVNARNHALDVRCG